MVEENGRSYFNKAEVERLKKESREYEAMTVLDELFKLTRQYKKSASYFELLRFIAHFGIIHRLMPCLHIQMPGARFLIQPNVGMMIQQAD